jgi:hypothetical protein
MSPDASWADRLSELKRYDSYHPSTTFLKSEQKQEMRERCKPTDNNMRISGGHRQNKRREGPLGWGAPHPRSPMRTASPSWPQQLRRLVRMVGPAKPQVSELSPSTPAQHSSPICQEIPVPGGHAPMEILACQLKMSSSEGRSSGGGEWGGGFTPPPPLSPSSSSSSSSPPED